MSVRLMQKRYLGTGGESNISDFNDLTTPGNFLGADQKAIQIGIQAPEGTTFKISTTSNSSGWGDPITIGRTGIFEWSVAGTGFYIRGFQFMNTPAGSSKSYIVDFYLVE